MPECLYGAKNKNNICCLATTRSNRKRHKSTQNVEMKSVKFSRSMSACELSGEPAVGCVSRCGMCPPCVFAPKPPGFTRCVWRVSDEFRRRFLVELLLRCRNVQVLENIQCVLGVTSWSLFTYARSRGPTSPEEYRCSRRSSDRDRDRDVGGKQPLGMDLREIWSWFSSSPDWMKSRYLCRLFLLCDPELLRMVANLTSVLLVRQRRGFLQSDLRSCNSTQFDQDTDEDSEDPALMVVPGSSKSLSGVSRYRDFISCLPVNLSKRILGLLEEHTLRCCQKVCRYWQHLAKETMEEFKFRRKFQEQIQTIMNTYKSVSVISPTYSSIVAVPVPTKDDEEADIRSSVQKAMPFEAAYAKIKTKTVRMEERNVYCGAYFTKVLLDKEDPHRVVDYRGKSFMAMGSKDRAVHLFYVGSETKAVSVMRGHVGSIRAVLLCEDRHLIITAGCDASIRCWSLKTDRCVMELYGHTGTINCLDVHGDTLVSGSKDGLVKVWNLHTGNQLEDFHFKHPSSVRCVKVSATTVCSSCDRGLVKIWDMEKASLLRVIDAHKKSVKCLFFDEWHLLSGDSNGQVMAWSVSSHAKECLMTFSHPKEVKSLTLVHLRVVTGCMDGKIRIFNFLTGDCLKDITAEAESGRLMSLHFHDNSILVNLTSSVKLLQFAKMFWEGREARAGGQGDVVASEKSAASVKKFPSACFGADQKAQVASPSRKMRSCESKTPERAALRYHTHFLFTPTKCHTAGKHAQMCVKSRNVISADQCVPKANICITVKERREAAKQLQLSEKATCERMKKRGPHHPPTRDSILLRVGAIQRAQCMDEVSVNMECNARLRDSWGPHTPQDPLCSDSQALKKNLHTQICPPQHTHHRRAKTCVPILKRGTSQTVTHTDATRTPDTTRSHRHCLVSGETQPLTADTRRAIETAGAKERPPAPESMLTRSLPDLKYDIKAGASLLKLNCFGPAQRAGLIQAGRQRPSREGAHAGHHQMI